MNKKNGGNVPVCNDERTRYVPVGCGNCIECRKQKARNWQIRLQEEIRHDNTGKFVTLTFSNESIKKLTTEIKGLTGYELDNEIATLATRRFLERWRKKYKKSLKHWLVTELGHNGTENLHMHGIVWTTANLNEVEKYWKYGHIWKGKRNKQGGLENYVNDKTISYTTKYVSKMDKVHREYKSKILTSPGIGAGYTTRPDFNANKYNGKQTKEYYTTRTGHKIALPTYFRNKRYSEEEREQLWLNTLDKQERWVLGQRINISQGDNKYYQALKEAQQKNKRLGYGNDEKNWERKNYENQLRQMKINERLKKG